jgi:hypothetical protein
MGYGGDPLTISRIFNEPQKFIHEISLEVCARHEKIQTQSCIDYVHETKKNFVVFVVFNSDFEFSSPDMLWNRIGSLTKSFRITFHEMRFRYCANPDGPLCLFCEMEWSISAKRVSQNSETISCREQ